MQGCVCGRGGGGLNSHTQPQRGEENRRRVGELIVFIETHKV